MTSEPQEGMSSLDKWDKRWSIISKMVVVIGLIFTYCEYQQTKKLNETEVAIEAIKEAKSIDFLKKIKKFNSLRVYLENDTTGTKTIEDGMKLLMLSEGLDISDDTETAKYYQNFTIEVAQVLNTYDRLAILHINEAANREIIEGNICLELKEFNDFLNIWNEKLEVVIANKKRTKDNTPVDSFSLLLFRENIDKLRYSCRNILNETSTKK